MLCKPLFYIRYNTKIHNKLGFSGNKILKCNAEIFSVLNNKKIFFDIPRSTGFGFIFSLYQN
jgi:hypothetical protein